MNSRALDSQQITRIKKKTYMLLNKMHDVERGRKVGRIYNVTCERGHYILICIRSIQKMIADASQGIQDQEIKSKLYQFQRSIDHLETQVQASIGQGTTLNRGIIGPVLRAHTLLFNCLKKKKIFVEFPSKELSDALLTGVIIWGNKIPQP